MSRSLETVAALKELEARCAALSMDEIRERLKPIFAGMWVRSPIFDPGMFVYRARRVTPTFNTSKPMSLADLKHPPAELARQGRANRAGQPMFYCSGMKEPLFFEIGELNAGDELILSSWKSRSRMLLNNIGYTNLVFQELGAKRPCPTWEDLRDGKAAISVPEGGAELLPSILEVTDNDALRAELSKLFMKRAEDATLEYYKLTAAIAEAHLGTVNDTDEFAGILYPSVRMWANGDNIALTPRYADEHLEFRRATRVRIDKCKANGFDITYVECAKQVDEAGYLKWLGRLLTWQIPPQTTAICVATPGRDDDGEYSADKDGSPLYWRVTNSATGKVIEAA